MVMDENGAPVFLRVYDISAGAARTWSPILLGKKVDGVWHSGIEAYGYEYFYGGGIVKMRPENVETTFGITPSHVHHLGNTVISRNQLEKYLLNILQMFRREVYDLVNWNCNHFSDHLAKYLVNRGIPSYILELPNEIKKTFMGKILLNFIKMMQGGAAPVGIDDPDHPSRVLGSDTRPRRNSAPALSPCGKMTAGSAFFTAPVANASIFKPSGTVKSGRRASTGHISRTADEADVILGDSVQHIRCAPIGDSETGIAFSPKHKRLYETERDNYAPRQIVRLPRARIGNVRRGSIGS